MAIQPGPPDQRDGAPGTDTAELPAVRTRRGRHPLIAACCVVVGLCGLAVTAFGLYRQVTPRVFSPGQRQRIEAWEVARRWRTTPKTEIFPIVVYYRLPGEQLGSAGALKLTARRLEIAGQSPCASAAGGSQPVESLLARDGCQALLRATYTDASSSMVLTVGIAVLRDQASADSAARTLASGTVSSQGALASRLVLLPFAVSGTPAGAFGVRQRQLSWVAAAGPYLVLATVGYADGRPHVPVTTDAYTLLEMTSMAQGVVAAIVAPLGAPVPVPHCPGGPAC